jgi:hypothetical protein
MTRNKIRPELFICCFVFATLAAAVSADEVAPAEEEVWHVGGHLKYQANQATVSRDNFVLMHVVPFTLVTPPIPIGTIFNGETNFLDQTADARLKIEGRAHGYEMVLHDQVLAVGGDYAEALSRLDKESRQFSGVPSGAIETTRTMLQRMNPGSRLPSDDQRAFDLDKVIHDSSRSASVHRLDRLYVGYNNADSLVRFGRQVFTWGDGLVFNPMDFINPFPPTAVDTEYKTGEDMLFAQTTVSGIGNFQGAYVMRRDENGSIGRDVASAALKFRGEMGAATFDVMAAEHYDQRVTGLGLSGPVGETMVRANVVATDTGPHEVVSGVLNVDYSWTFLKHNVYGYLEYYRNGYGRRSIDLAQLNENPDLTQRVARGEVFTLGRDYFSAGMKIELTPLLKLNPGAIFNMNDRSGMALLHLEYEMHSDLMLYAGIDSPFGAHGSEFGGIALPLPISETVFYSAPARQLFVRVAQYF